MNDSSSLRTGFPLTFGLDTFGDVHSDENGTLNSHAQTVRNIVEQGVLADSVGIDFFGIGEHHTDDYPLSAGDLVLSAIAARTKDIHLGSAVTVLSSDDPVRVFQRYSTLNALSSGRAEVILGRGSSIDSFPLFGYDLSDYEVLFEEKSELFAQLLKGSPVTWNGTTRAALKDQDVVPHLEAEPFPTWIGVGGSPQSVVRAARHGYNLILAIIGGSPARFQPFSNLYLEALEHFERPAQPIGVHSMGHVAETDEQAQEEFWPRYLEVIKHVSKTRGFAIPTPESFKHDIGPHGAIYVGSPETVARKIAANLRVLHASRFQLKFGMTGLPHTSVMNNIELYGTKVIPLVREILGSES
ncbi:LLM class flavin-dependent oxidoreductase [Arthrobacter zhaoguopingii]|uniref:LLM class flavin-dependent oxidoreductase n=1 Tax=Arthrobacter zhaoguopingii TaxID=2681491 RepID=UPI00135BB3BC|nr:LLM class flavin-dependent oxidoreductase [Arthrobacter zhaoguopingii]